MNRKISIIYTWLVRTALFIFPDIPIVMMARGWLYGFMMARKGKNFQVAHSAILNSITELEVGDNVYCANNVIILCGGGVVLGDNVLFSPGVLISSNNHTYLDGSGYRFGDIDRGKVKVGSGAWICSNSVITKGACFPSNSVLTPCSNYRSSESIAGIYSGNPALLVKKNDGL